MIAYIYFIYSVIVIISVALFGFGLDGGSMRNIPLLIVILSVIFLLLIIRFIKYTSVFVKANKKLKANGYKILKFNILPPVFRRNKNHIIAEKDGECVNIFVVIVRKSYLTYHFESESTLELYKFTRLAIKPGFRQANIVSGHVEKRRIGIKKLSWFENEKEPLNIVLFNKIPNAITDSCSSKELGHGDEICNKITVWNLDRL
ncbi:MAG: hypothetical protein J6B60_04950 [Clostridia bacterium]|nr:hypothetical protein [Clostridia bacterium]